MKNKEERIEISKEIDITKAISGTMRLAEIAGFNLTEQYMVSTATSELVRNIFTYTKRGEITIRILERGAKITVRKWV